MIKKYEDYGDTLDLVLCLQAKSRLFDSCVLYSDFTVNFSFLKQISSFQEGMYPSK